MKKTIAALVAAVTLGGVSGSASAVEIRGTPSCGEWVEEHDPISTLRVARIRQESWLVGYLSGIAIYTDNDILKGTDNASLFLWMTNYCKENPLNDINGGADVLYSVLKKKNRIK